MFTAALFTVPKTWKQSRYPSTDERIKKMGVCVCVCTVEYYLVAKKRMNFCICSNMDGLGGDYAK